MVTRPPGRGPTPRDQQGAAATEYALLASLIAIAVLLAVTALGQGVKGLFSQGLLDALLP